MNTTSNQNSAGETLPAREEYPSAVYAVHFGDQTSVLVETLKQNVWDRENYVMRRAEDVTGKSVEHAFLRFEGSGKAIVAPMIPAER